jgi:hypothetical protein
VRAPAFQCRSALPFRSLKDGLIGIQATNRWCSGQAVVVPFGASNDGESRYSPATCIGCRTGVIAGNPDPKHISTSYVDRQNLSMRMGMRRFTRLTNGFSKKFENHAHQVVLYFMHDNYCRACIQLDKTLVIQDNDKPLAVLLKYEHFLAMQERILKCNQ